ncbi:642_t:CDS:2 [Cetraspora pellucida]|uniref:642_t:CDS:1 n=1 Tax=Cetraspora pellucida TaxID=1433469 RepID=A0ACA9MK54_9GLOM|nr:642_t:CDS:2 [Cetraspora pellucida]
MSSASNKRTKTEVNRASNKAFDLLTKEEKVDKKVNTGKSSTLKSPSIVETGLAKDKELDWANEVENNIKTEKMSKLLLFSKGKDNKETCVNLAQVSTTQTNTSQVNKTTITNHVNSKDQPIAETQSINQSVSDTAATPVQESPENPYVNEMQITSQPIDASLPSSLESTIQDSDPSGQDSPTNTVADAASNIMTKETSNSGITENSDSSEVEEDNNMEEVTFTTVTSKKRKKKNKQRTGNLLLENAERSPTQGLSRTKI